jgi:hypothetical protein
MAAGQRLQRLDRGIGFACGFQRIGPADLGGDKAGLSGKAA